MRIEALTKLTPPVHEALGRLLPKPNANLPMPDLDRLNRLLNDPDVVLLIARDGERIVGTTTVIVYTTPYWIKARLDEVVVDESARGRGVGEAPVKAALDVGRERGAQVAELQSGRGPERAAGHQVYERLDHTRCLPRPRPRHDGAVRPNGLPVARRASPSGVVRRGDPVRVLVHVEVAVQVRVELPPGGTDPVPVAPTDIDLGSEDLEHQVRHQ